MVRCGGVYGWDQGVRICGAASERISMLLQCPLLYNVIALEVWVIA